MFQKYSYVGAKFTSVQKISNSRNHSMALENGNFLDGNF